MDGKKVGTDTEAAMSDPSISVVMPVYNASATLGAAVESICAQSFEDWEYIIIDDGSSDGSVALLEDWAAKEPRIRIFKNPENLGLPRSLNRGLSESRGRYIARMDADDICEPERLRKQVEWMEVHPDTVLCGTWVQFFGSKTHVRQMPTEHEELRVKMLLEYPFEHPTLMMRRSFLQEHDLRYNESLRLSEDLDLCHRVARKGRVTNLPEPLLRLRQHDQRTHRTQPDVLKQGVGLVYARQMEEFDLSTGDSDLYFRIRADVECCDIDDAQERTDWFEKVIRANREKKVYSQEVLESYLTRRWEDWLRVTAKHLKGCGKIFRGSSMSKRVKPGWWSRYQLSRKLG
ncbi:MAG: glycosyltransferase family 2 protein [Verrucomicrobiota bacterium]